MTLAGVAQPGQTGIYGAPPMPLAPPHRADP
jgi:hypothetical protein